MRSVFFITGFMWQIITLVVSLSCKMGTVFQLNFCLILLQLHFIYAVKLSGGGGRDLSLISKLFLFGAASLQRSPPIKDQLAVVPHLMLSSFRGPE